MYLNGSLVRVALHACLSRCSCLVFSNLAALRHLQREIVTDYSPIRPITNSNMVQDVQVQADSGGEYIDHTSLQMHRRGGCCMQKACIQHESTVIQSSFESQLVITIRLETGAGL